MSHQAARPEGKEQGKMRSAEMRDHVGVFTQAAQFYEVNEVSMMQN